MEKAEQEENEEQQIKSNAPKSVLEPKYDIKFSLLCQLFENCIKAKTKSKVK